MDGLDGLGVLVYDRDLTVLDTYLGAVGRAALGGERCTVDRIAQDDIAIYEVTVGPVVLDVAIAAPRPAPARPGRCGVRSGYESDKRCLRPRVAR